MIRGARKNFSGGMGMLYKERRTKNREIKERRCDSQPAMQEA
jgi:hypothetical protein